MGLKNEEIEVLLGGILKELDLINARLSGFRETEEMLARIIESRFDQVISATQSLHQRLQRLEEDASDRQRKREQRYSRDLRWPKWDSPF